MHKRIIVGVLTVTPLLVLGATAVAQIGREVAIQTHLNDGQEFQVSTRDLISFGKSLFTAVWTSRREADVR